MRVLCEPCIVVDVRLRPRTSASVLYTTIEHQRRDLIFQSIQTLLQGLEAILSIIKVAVGK